MHATHAHHDALTRALHARDWRALIVATGWASETDQALPLVPAAWHAWGLCPQTHAARDLQLTALASSRGLIVLLAEGDAPPGALRQAALSVWRHNPTAPLIWLRPEPHQLTALMVDEGPGRAPLVRAMSLPLGDAGAGVDPRAIAQWASLTRAERAPDVIDEAHDVRRLLRHAFGQEGLTRRFFDGVVALHQRLRDVMIDGPACEDARAQIALSVLLRLIVLHFLQARGALDHDPHFLLTRWRHTLARGGDFYREILAPLSFGALNLPPAQRPEAARALGALPFLNGGLFEPTPDEQAHPALTWPQDLWEDALEGFFARHRFALVAGDESDEHAAIDPEVLGKVFEGLMGEVTRQCTGSFYTPRDVVRRMTCEGLVGHLITRAELDEALAREVVEGRAGTLSPRQRERVTRALAQLAILDPAVGTGAFLLESLTALRRCWRGLGAGEADTFDGVRRLIHDHLHGVDLHPTAVRLCEVRLWLALLATLPARLDDLSALAPLPNLSHRIARGDALATPLDLLRVRVDEGGAWAGESDASARARARAIGTAQRLYMTSHGDDKARAQRALELEERALYDELLQARRARLASRRDALNHQTADLFGAAPRKPHATTRALDRQLQALDDALSSLGARAPAFCYEARFCEAIAAGGFDLILTNPPWVRGNRVDAALKGVYTARYPDCQAPLWEGASEAGVTATFGAQVDLAAMFLERALELLRPDGQLVALIPAKLLRGLHGCGLRALLSRHVLRRVEDHADASRAMFEATTYPALLHVQRASQPSARRAPRVAPLVQVVTWRGAEAQQWRCAPSALWASGAHAGEPWLMETPQVQAWLARLRRAGPPLGSRSALRPARGVMTGCNAAFVREVASLRAQGWSDEDLSRLSRLAIGGRDVQAWQTRAPGARLLWTCDATMQPLRALPAPLSQALTPHRAALERRADWRPGRPWWELFRAQAGLAQPKVVWADMGQRLEAAVVSEDVAPLNTCYYIPCPDAPRAWALAALLNAPPARLWARTLAERARGGWRRHLAWVICLLPVPDALAAWLEGAPDPALDAWAASLCEDEAARADSARVIGALYELDPATLASIDAWCDETHPSVAARDGLDQEALSWAS